MSIRHHARMIVALAAAYALALQAVFLAIGSPFGGTTAFSGVPICSSLGADRSTPAGQGQDCLGICLAGCCCGAAAAPAPGATVLTYVSDASQKLPAALDADPILLRNAFGAHRSRAPPFA
jgi:hypothetical protein